MNIAVIETAKSLFTERTALPEYASVHPTRIAADCFIEAARGADVEVGSPEIRELVEAARAEFAPLERIEWERRVQLLERPARTNDLAPEPLRGITGVARPDAYSFYFCEDDFPQTLEFRPHETTPELDIYMIDGWIPLEKRAVDFLP